MDKNQFTDMIAIDPQICKINGEPPKHQVAVNKQGDVYLAGYSHCGAYYYLFFIESEFFNLTTFENVMEKLRSYCEAGTVYSRPIGFSGYTFEEEGFVSREFELRELTYQNICNFYERSTFPTPKEVTQKRKDISEYLSWMSRIK